MNSQTTKIVSKQSFHLMKTCNWLGIACCCLIFIMDTLRWMRGEPHISLLAIGIMIGALGNFVLIKQLENPQQPWPLSAKGYYIGALTLSSIISFIMLAHLCGFVRLPHIFH